jgi:AraC-like DNA-binding protein
MIERRALFHRHGIELSDVACRHGAGRGETAESSPTHMIVFVRRGCFVRSADGAAALLDPTTAFCSNPDEEQRYDHPHPYGDDCTAIALDPATVASLWGDEQRLPAGPLPTSSDLDLQHRLLLAAARRGDEADELYEQALDLIACALAARDPARVAAGKPATDRARRALVDQTREALLEQPGRSLPSIARELAVSPHHLSRTFRARTGHTISRYRLLLRARAGLERIAGGERDLARLAADVGFADQSHLCREIRRQTGQTPSALRDALRADLPVPSS